MYTNTWYVAERSDNLADKPLHLRMLGREFVLFRDAQGNAACLSGVCIHRGARLAGGRCHDDGTVACPFHGWRFNAAGRCTHIPSEQGVSEPPARARVDSYPVEERYGLVWVFLGDDPDSAMPLPEMPQYDDESWARFTYEEVWDANVHWAKMANLDHVHLPIVHGTGFGGDNPVRPPEHEVEFTDNGFRTQIVVQPPPPDGKWNELRDAKRRVVSRLTFFVPGFTLRGDVEVGGAGSGMRFVFYETSTPVDETTTHMRWIFFRNFMTEESQNAEHMRRNQKNIGEDRVIAEAMRPRVPPAQPPGGALNIDREDRLIQAYWESMRRMQDAGWMIDRAALAAAEAGHDNHYRVIPSPARRADPEGWLHPPVPRVPAGGQRATAGKIRRGTG